MMLFNEGTASFGGLTTSAIPSADQVEFIGVQVTGTFVGTLVFEATVDGTNYVAVAAKDLASGTGALVTSVTAPAILQIDVRGIKCLQARCSAYTSGTAVVSWVTEREF